MTQPESKEGLSVEQVDSKKKAGGLGNELIFGLLKWTKGNPVGGEGYRVVSYNDMTRKEAMNMMASLNRRGTKIVREEDLK